MTRREPRREQSSRPDRPSEERSLDALLEGGLPPEGDRARWQPVSQVLTALTSVPESSELSGEARALAEFRVRPLDEAGPAPAGRPGRVTGPHRVIWLHRVIWAHRVIWRHGPRPAVAAATSAVLIGGLLAVAYAGDLPAAAQRLAHNTIGAPAAGRGASAGPEPDHSSRLATSAGQAGARSGHGSPQPDRRTPHGPTPSSPRHHRVSGSPPGPAGGRLPGQQGTGHQGTGHQGSGSPGPGSPGPGSPEPSGSPSGSPTPAPTQQPSPPASLAPSADPAPSPSAAGSTLRRFRHHRQPDPGGSSSSPP